MTTSSQTAVPLFGALCVAEGLISEEQLDFCLLLQQQEYAGMPLGHILVRCGYMDEENVARLLELQRELKAATSTAGRSSERRPADLTALILSDRPVAALLALLEDQGVAAQVRFTWQDLLDASDSSYPDLVFVEPRLIPHYARPAFDLAAPTWVLPATGDDGKQPFWAQEALKQFVQQFRDGLLPEMCGAEGAQREAPVEVFSAMSQAKHGMRLWRSIFGSHRSAPSAR